MSAQLYSKALLLTEASQSPVHFKLLLNHYQSQSYLFQLHSSLPYVSFLHFLEPLLKIPESSLLLLPVAPGLCYLNLA